MCPPATLRGASATGSVPLRAGQLSAPLEIGFPFEFYGIEYSTFRISSSGFITLGSRFESPGCCSGRPIGSASSPNNFVAAWWGSLNASAGSIRFETIGSPGARSLVVGFYHLPHFVGGPPVTFEIVLHEGSNAIEIQCWTCPSDGGSHTAGIENADGTIGLQVASTRSPLRRAGWVIAPSNPPDCSSATRMPESIWPPNGEFVEISIDGVIDRDGDPVSLQVDEILQDERLGGRGDPKTGADAWGIGSTLARVRAERSAGDGRVYHIRFSASDPIGLSCAGEFTVCVPHRKAAECVDQGPLYDASLPPSLASSDPPPGAAAVPRTSWVRLTLLGPLKDPEEIHLRCDGALVEVDATVLDTRTAVLNPRGELPPGGFCRVRYVGNHGPEEFFFRVAAGQGSETVLYDRMDLAFLNTFPDDYWLIDDPTTPSGKRIQVRVGRIPDPQQRANGRAVAAAIQDRDGFSPIQDLVFSLSRAADGASFPADESASLDPGAPVGLFDMDPRSPGFGKRVPFTLRIRSDVGPDGTVDHTGVLFPAVRLEPGGRYAFVLTNRLHAAADPSRPFLPSPFFERVAAPPAPDEPARVTRARKSIAPVLDFLATTPSWPLLPSCRSPRRTSRWR
ncbi:MAG: Ig-like domain-containing domain [Planctomycetota bacterium]